MGHDEIGGWQMHLKHIRPRSVEWYDALLQEGARVGVEQRLSPEETMRLRTLLAMEEAEGSPLARRAPPRLPVRQHALRNA